MSNFLKGWELAEEDKPIDFAAEYRLYYNDQGYITQKVCTERGVLPPSGKYLVVDSETYKVTWADARIVDGKITYPPPPKPFRLIKKAGGKYGTLKDDPWIVGDEEYWDDDEN